MPAHPALTAFDPYGNGRMIPYCPTYLQITRMILFCQSHLPGLGCRLSRIEATGPSWRQSSSVKEACT
jgi:hypothetical protein